MSTTSRPPRSSAGRTTAGAAAGSRYHHGDLRNALLQAALACDPLETVSLRQLAAGLGVSAAAVYRHFESREHLLLTLAGLGFERLHEAFAQAFDLAAPPRDAADARARLRHLGEAYLGFADREPASWRLMFGPLAQPYRRRGPGDGRPDTLQYLSAALLGLHRTGVLPRAPTDADLLFAWSAIHGLCALRLGGVPGARAPAPALADAFARGVVGGLAAG